MTSMLLSVMIAVEYFDKRFLLIPVNKCCTFISFCPQIYFVYHIEKKSAYEIVSYLYVSTFCLFKVSSGEASTAWAQHFVTSSLVFSISLWRKKKNPCSEEFHMLKWQALALLSALLPSLSRLLSSCSSYHSPPLFIQPTSDKSCHNETLLSKSRRNPPNGALGKSRNGPNQRFL